MAREKTDRTAYMFARVSPELKARFAEKARRARRSMAAELEVAMERHAPQRLTPEEKKAK